MNTPERILIIQTAFLGDVVLATSLLEALHLRFPLASLDFMVRKGNEGLLRGHPYIHRLLIWDKSRKYSSLWQCLRQIRSERYDILINVQRFGTTGLLSLLSGADTVVGFDKNPFAFGFDIRVPHVIGPQAHEITRNQALIASWVSADALPPRLYPSQADYDKVKPLQERPYLCLAPASVWHTKQWPAAKWVELITALPVAYKIFLLGAPGDMALCRQIAAQAGKPQVQVLAGELSLLQSAALMQGAVLNVVNDSAPMHLASAVDAPVCAIFCSTIPDFGFGPLSSRSAVVEIREKLDCRPCGLHGFSACPQGHFACAQRIDIRQVLAVLERWRADVPL